MPRVAWTLTDNSTGSPVVYEFPINPNEFEPPGRQARITSEYAVAPSGGVIQFQGRDQVSTGSFSGAILSSAHWSDIQEWADKWYPLVLKIDTDDTWTILITQFTWKRVSRRNRYRYDYTINFIEVA